MATLRERQAEEVIEAIIDVELYARELRAHSTVRSNRTLLANVDAIQQSGRLAATLACLLYFKGDSLADLPPAA